MIKFFRKIRQNLLSENKFSKYLIYAIGEIILVVIGILIALAINNWNQEKIIKDEEIAILKAMETDFLETKNRIKKTIRNQKTVVNYCYKLQLLMQEQTNVDSISDYIYFGALSFWRIEPVNGTHDGLIGSGKMDIISNQKLKSLLAEFSAEIKYGFEDEGLALDLTSELIKLSSDYAASLEPESDRKRHGLNKPITEDERNLAILKHQKNNSFLGVLVTKAYTEKNRLEYQTKISSFVDNILKLIESEIKLKE